MTHHASDTLAACSSPPCSSRATGRRRRERAPRELRARGELHALLSEVDAQADERAARATRRPARARRARRAAAPTPARRARAATPAPASKAEPGPAPARARASRAGLGNALVQEEERKKGAVKLRVVARYLALGGTRLGSRSRSLGDRRRARVPLSLCRQRESRARARERVSRARPEVLACLDTPQVRVAPRGVGRRDARERRAAALAEPVLVRRAPLSRILKNLRISLRYVGRTSAHRTARARRSRARSSTSAAGARRSAIHERMLARVLRAPTSWFDRTPVGRVQNRFSNDLQQVDRVIPSTSQLRRPGSSGRGSPCTRRRRAARRAAGARAATARARRRRLGAVRARVPLAARDPRCATRVARAPRNAPITPDIPSAAPAAARTRRPNRRATRSSTRRSSASRPCARSTARARAARAPLRRARRRDEPPSSRCSRATTGCSSG